MMTAIQLIFSPFETWQKIAEAERGLVRTLSLYLLPLLIISVGAEVYFLMRWGEKQGEFGDMIRPSAEVVMRYGVAYLVLLLAAVFMSAKFLRMMAESFNVRTGFTQCFVLVAYAFGPIIMTRIIDGFPQINTWVCWIIGAVCSASVLYHGIGMMLKPEQTKGFGLYLIGVLTVVLFSGLAHFAAVGVLRGKIMRPKVAQPSAVERGRSSSAARPNAPKSWERAAAIAHGRSELCAAALLWRPGTCRPPLGQRLSGPPPAAERSLDYPVVGLQSGFGLRLRPLG